MTLSDAPGMDFECLDSPAGNCDGPVEYRMALSDTGRSYPRCDKHWHERCEKQDES